MVVDTIALWSLLPCKRFQFPFKEAIVVWNCNLYKFNLFSVLLLHLFYITSNLTFLHCLETRIIRVTKIAFKNIYLTSRCKTCFVDLTKTFMQPLGYEFGSNLLFGQAQQVLHQFSIDIYKQSKFTTPIKILFSGALNMNCKMRIWITNALKEKTFLYEKNVFCSKAKFWVVSANFYKCYIYVYIY